MKLCKKPYFINFFLNHSCTLSIGLNDPCEPLPNQDIVILKKIVNNATKAKR